MKETHDSSCCFAAAAAKSLQSCPTLCDPIDGSPPIELLRNHHCLLIFPQITLPPRSTVAATLFIMFSMRLCT